MLKIPKVDPNAPVAVIDLGNSHTSVGTWTDGKVKSPLSVTTGDWAAFEQVLQAHQTEAPKGGLTTAVICSVVPRMLDELSERAAKILGRPALVVGESIPLPMDISVVDPKAIGRDRVCAAAAVFQKLQRGCIVVDFGTAVTIDLVDDDGVLLGGAILPGVRLQFQALHEHTGQLPLAPSELPELPYGRDTIEALQTGVLRGIAGAVRNIVEGYATSLSRWPQVVATGGDVVLMMPICDFLDTTVQHLVLQGTGLAFSKYLAEQGV